MHQIQHTIVYIKVQMRLDPVLPYITMVVIQSATQWYLQVDVYSSTKCT